jgi:hypothetical protein
MSTEKLLARLDAVRGIGPDRWLSKCPAHDDRKPSLAIRELDDGRTLVHDFGGCAVEDVLAAVGLTFDTLFPERVGACKPERRPFPAADVLRAIAFEALLVATAASNLANGIELSEEDHKRLMVASGRIAAAVEESGHA